jgi:hypothetical protein
VPEDQLPDIDLDVTGMSSLGSARQLHRDLAHFDNPGLPGLALLEEAARLSDPWCKLLVRRVRDARQARLLGALIFRRLRVARQHTALSRLIADVRRASIALPALANPARTPRQLRGPNGAPVAELAA